MISEDWEVSASDYFCFGESAEAVLLQLQLHYVHSRLSVGGGLHWLHFSASRKIRDEQYCRPEIVEYIAEYDVDGQSLGLSLSAQVHIGWDLYVELNYLPTILLKDVRDFHFDYSHTAYLGGTWKTTIKSF